MVGFLVLPEACLENFSVQFSMSYLCSCVPRTEEKTRGETAGGRIYKGLAMDGLERGNGPRDTFQLFALMAVMVSIGP
jgi:hypothetical protein